MSVMIIAELQASESFRLVDLSSYEIMDTPAESDFDELVELAAEICNCPISMITLLDKDRQWFKAKKGLDITHTPRDLAFCSHAILQDEVMVVEDTAKDIRFFDSPLVTGDADVRFYAGAPIISGAGHRLGTLCIVDHAPRHLSAKEERALTILSNQVTKLLELRKKNILIRTRAEEIITVKSNALSTIIKKQEAEKKSIASDMHEDLAQGLASSIFYLQTAAENTEQTMPLLQTAKTQLQNILVRMQDLSYAITPHFIDLIPASDLVFEYIEKIAGTFPFQVKLKREGTEDNATAENAIGAIRIIEQWLKLLADKSTVSLVTVTIRPGKHFELLMEDNGQSNGDATGDYELLEKDILDSLVYERAYAQGGTVELAILPGKNTVKISLPVIHPAA